MIFGICATLTVGVVTLTRGDFNSESSSWELQGWDGQCSLDLIKNSGPFNNNLFSTRWVAVVPRVAMSAWFCLVGTYFRAFFKDFPVGGHFLKRDLSVR